MNASASHSELDALWENVYDSPELYPQMLDIDADTITFTPMTAATYRSSMFLDERIQRAHPVVAKVGLKDFVAAFDDARPSPKPVGFVFHTGYCCSTLLARCLEELSGTLVLKEPVPIRMLSERWFGSTDAGTLRKMRDVLAVLLSRRFNDEAVVIKATSVCNVIMMDLMKMHEDARAVFVYSDLEDSIAFFLKDPTRRLEARQFLLAMEPRLPADLSSLHPGRLIDASAIALLWLLQVWWYCELATSSLAGRLVALNCNQLLANPVATLDRVTSHLGIECPASAIEAAVAGSAFNTHAKGGARFGRDNRNTDLQRLVNAHPDEIRFASDWARQLPLWKRISKPLPAEIIADAFNT